MNLYDLHQNPKSLDHHDSAHDLVPELAWNRYKGNEAALRERENLWSQNAKTAFGYTASVLFKRFKKGEIAIAEDPYYAYLYMRMMLLQGILRTPIPAIEKVILASEYRDEYLELIGKK